MFFTPSSWTEHCCSRFEDNNKTRCSSSNAVPLCMSTLDTGGKNVSRTLFGTGPYQLITSIWSGDMLEHRRRWLQLVSLRWLACYVACSDWLMLKLNPLAQLYFERTKMLRKTRWMLQRLVNLRHGNILVSPCQIGKDKRWQTENTMPTLLVLCHISTPDWHLVLVASNITQTYRSYMQNLKLITLSNAHLLHLFCTYYNVQSLLV